MSRRAFVEGGLAIIGATTLVPRRPGFAAPAPALPPVVGFGMDRPFLDLTGLAQPYIPPVGMRSGQPLATLSDDVLLSGLRL